MIKQSKNREFFSLILRETHSSQGILSQLWQKDSLMIMTVFNLTFHTVLFKEHGAVGGFEISPLPYDDRVWLFSLLTFVVCI